MSDTGSRCIPFVNTPTDASIASQFYKDCGFVRLGLQQFDDLNHHLPSTCKRWIDGGTDGLGQTKLARTSFSLITGSSCTIQRFRPSRIQES